MTNRFSRRFLLTTAAALAAMPNYGFSAPPTVSLRPQLRPEDFSKRAIPDAAELIRRAELGGTVGFAVADLKTGQVLESSDAGAALPPASVMKVITAIYALEKLGGGHRFTTRLLATGPVTDGVLNGDLILAGGGDPTLNTDALADMARDLKATGLREVRGRFLVWDGALPYAREIDKEQPPHVGYNPAVSGLALNYNRVHFEWRRAGSGYGVTMDARSDNYRPEVRVARMAIVTRDLPIYTYQDKGGTDQWTVARGALGKGGSRWLPVRRPALYTGEVFRSFARAQGIVLKEESETQVLPQSARVLANHDSAPLRVILRDMLKYSTNLTAEMVGLAATKAAGGNAGSIRASATSMDRWASQVLGLRGAKLVDHSGLGSDSRVRAADLLGALTRSGQAQVLRPLLKDIAMRDARGKINRGHPIKVQAKTGTLNFVSALAGYMTAKDGTDLAFVIFTANTAKRRAIPKSEREAPSGAGGWNKRSKQLQQALIERWGALYGA